MTVVAVSEPMTFYVFKSCSDFTTTSGCQRSQAEKRTQSDEAFNVLNVFWSGGVKA